MGKNAKANKRRRLNGPGAPAPTPAKELLSPPSVGALEGGGDEGEEGWTALVSRDELEIATETLEILARNGECLKDKAFKRLKTSAYALHQVLATGASLTSRISSALADGRWIDSLVLLSELAIRGEQPKLGALQRWVRECDAASTAQPDEREEVMRVLDQILRVAGAGAGSSQLPTATRVVRRLDEWVVPEAPVQGRVAVWERARTATLLTPERTAALLAHFRTISHVTGPERNPPNLHPAVIHAHVDEAFTLDVNDEPRLKRVKRHDVPGVEGAFLLTDVLSADECLQIVQAASAVKFLPDQPAAGSAVDKLSILAHNAILFAGSALRERVFERMRAHVEQEFMGGEVRGVNARWRVYRYEPGHVYRPHIDGAWPASGLDESKPVAESYVYDSAPADDPQWSRFTLLFYLNDDFKDGHTTFFVPSPSSSSGLLATPVKPRQGAVLVFPHGVAKGSLLHEGSGVTEGGKYVIRTDLLYSVKQAYGKQGGGKRRRDEESVAVP